MANTLAGINIAQIAQLTLQVLHETFLPIDLFATDFSNEVMQKGESVTTRIPASAADQDLDAGFTEQNVSTVARTVTLSHYRGHVRSFTDMEVSKSGDLVWLREIFAEPAVESVVAGFYTRMFAPVTAAAYGAPIWFGDPSAFDADVAADLATDLTEAKIGEIGRFAILKPRYYGNLTKDNAIQSVANRGNDDAVARHKVLQLHGIGFHQLNPLPHNSENLMGIVGKKHGLIFAARPAAMPNAFPGEVVNVVDDVTGLPLQARSWYDPNAGKHKVSIGLIYGMARGNEAALKRITSEDDPE